jgi:hypothetical protein
MRAVALFVAVAACYRPTPPSDVPCASNGECPAGLLCDVSRTPPVCVDHLPGIEPDGGPDAAPDAAPPDAMIPPTFVAAARANAGAVASLSYALTIPPGDRRFLLVSIQLGSNCSDAVPAILGVKYAGAALTRITTILGTPCGMTTTRSDQWQLVAPPVGTDNVEVTLAGAGDTIHSGALAFAGIDQMTPVRATANARGAGVQSSVAVASQPGDLVVNTVGQGGGIDAPGAGQTQRFKRNASGANTLDNSAASTAQAAGMTTTMTWTFNVADEWQSISSVLQP